MCYHYIPLWIFAVVGLQEYMLVIGPKPEKNRGKQKIQQKNRKKEKSKKVIKGTVIVTRKNQLKKRKCVGI